MMERSFVTDNYEKMRSFVVKAGLEEEFDRIIKTYSMDQNKDQEIIEKDEYLENCLQWMLAKLKGDKQLMEKLEQEAREMK